MDVVFSEFQEKVKTGVLKFVREAGIDAYFLGLGNMDPAFPENRLKTALLDMVSPGEFDGVIIVSTSLMNAGTLDSFKESLGRLKALPMVSIGPSVLGEERLGFDNRYGISRIMTHLIGDHGYRSFAYVSGPFTNVEAIERLEAFKESLAAAEIPFSSDMVYEGNFATSGGLESVETFLDERHLEPRAIVCANDQMAIGVWKGLAERGIPVPGRIAVCGYDGEDLSHAITHRITTLRQSFEQLGYIAAGRVYEKIQGEESPPLGLLKGELRLRSSCGCYSLEQRSAENEHSDIEHGQYSVYHTIVSHIREGCPHERTDAVYSRWTLIISEALENKESILELEHMLNTCEQTAAASPDPGAARYFLLSLYAVLQEECGHRLFLLNSVFRSISAKLQQAIDRLQKSLLDTLDFSIHREEFRHIAKLCGARHLHILEFRNFELTDRGAVVRYSTRESAPGSSWQPGPGAWFPDETGSMAVNIIAFDNLRYGYFLLDADIAYFGIYEYLRTRFSIISRDLQRHIDMQKLNKKLSLEVVERQKAELELKEALIMVKQLAIEDELTGLNNRRGFLTLAEQQMKYYHRAGIPFSILYADLDNLKTINDTWGHEEGDTAIRAAAEVLGSCLRDSDIIGRLGGDEFAALLQGNEHGDIEKIEDRIARACGAKNSLLNKPWALSMTLGHQNADPKGKESLQELLKKADSSLYRKKQQKKAGTGRGNN